MGRVVRFLLMCFLMICVSGCGGNGNALDLGGLRNEAGDYQFQELVWDSTPSEAEAVLGCALQDMGGVASLREYKAEEAYTWDGVKADLSCEFEQDKLETVSIHFIPKEEEIDVFWENLYNELSTLYGSVEENVQISTADDLQITTERVSYLWEATGNYHTALSISKLSINGEFKYIALNVYIVPEVKTVA